MSKPTARIVVFYDGTDNTPKDRTNVWRMHELLSSFGADGVPQVKKYIQGVGTEFGAYVRGSIFGIGVSRRIREGYRWLAEHYVDGAEIYVFGFSRGAFTARSLVQMVANVGLVRPAGLPEFDEDAAFERYEAISMQETMEIFPLWKLRFWQRTPAEAPARWVADPVERMLLDDTKVAAPRIKMAGLWDTVGAVGMNAINQLDTKTQKAAAHNVRPTALLENGYHAVAIDEHRKQFDITMWRTFVPKGAMNDAVSKYAGRYEQCWFVGAHSDVGGGYDDDEDRLPDITLEWMMQKATNLGLIFSRRIEPRPAAWNGHIHDSYSAFAFGVLAILEKLRPGNQRNYRTINKPAEPKTTAEGEEGELWTINEVIHPSVIQRWKEDPSYRPPSLVSLFQRNPGLLPDGTTTAQRTRRIYAKHYWNETGVFLRPGVRYRVRVVPGLGEPLKDGDFESRGIEGEDWDNMRHKTAALLHGKRKDDAKWFALIGTVDKDHDWAMSDGGEFTVPTGGQMVCYFNDVQVEWFYGNNAGWVTLEVEEVL